MSRKSWQQGDTELLERSEHKVTPPKRSEVVLLNDDRTTMDFVVMILVDVFYKTELEAHRIMLSVHERGEGVVGIFPSEVAKGKVAKVTKLADAAGFPLRCIARPVSS